MKTQVIIRLTRRAAANVTEIIGDFEQTVGWRIGCPDTYCACEIHVRAAFDELMLLSLRVKLHLMKEMPLLTNAPSTMRPSAKRNFISLRNSVLLNPLRVVASGVCSSNQ